MKKIIRKNFTPIFFSLMLVVYIGFQIYLAHGLRIKTETARFVSLCDSIDTKAVAIRDEVLLANPSTGVVNYLLEDGAKIANEGVIAEVYKSADDAMMRKEIGRIDKEIEKLKNIDQMASAYAVNPGSIDQQIAQLLDGILLDINRACYVNLENDLENFLYLLNEQSVGCGKIKNFEARISELENTKSSLQKASSEKLSSIISPAAGYFVSRVDGLENRFDYKNVFNLTLDDITSQDSIPCNTSAAAGKVIRGLNWYIACAIPRDKVSHLTEGADISAVFPAAYTESLPCRVMAINQSSKDEDAVAVLRCNFMNKELALLREEPVRLELSAHEGILIPKRAFHEDVLTKDTEDAQGEICTQEKKVQGVYVRFGKEVIFKQVVPVFAGSTYIICDPEPNEDQLFAGETVKVHDEIVVEGMDLHSGKIIK